MLHFWSGGAGVIVTHCKDPPLTFYFYNCYWQGIGVCTLWPALACIPVGCGCESQSDRLVGSGTPGLKISEVVSTNSHKILLFRPKYCTQSLECQFWTTILVSVVMPEPAGAGEKEPAPAGCYNNYTNKTEFFSLNLCSKFFSPEPVARPGVGAGQTWTGSTTLILVKTV